MKRLKKELDSEEYARLEGMMWILRKQHECLSEADKSKLELLYKYSPELKKAHSYALKLTCIFNSYCGRKSGMAKISRWIKKVEKIVLSLINSLVEFDTAKFLTHPFFIRSFVTCFRLLVACKRQNRVKSML